MVIKYLNLQCHICSATFPHSLWTSYTRETSAVPRSYEAAFYLRPLYFWSVMLAIVVRYVILLKAMVNHSTSQWTELQLRGKRGRGAPRGASSGRSRPHRNVSSTRSNSSSQLMRPKTSSNNSPFNLSLLALQPFSGLSNPLQAECSEASSPLQRKLDE